MESNIIGLGGSGLHTGARAAGVTMLYSEMTQMVVDSRWILIAVVLCCLLDFRLGCKERGMHKAEVAELKTVEEVEKYDIKEGYPKQLDINLQQ